MKGLRRSTEYDYLLLVCIGVGSASCLVPGPFLLLVFFRPMRFLYEKPKRRDV